MATQRFYKTLSNGTKIQAAFNVTKPRQGINTLRETLYALDVNKTTKLNSDTTPEIKQEYDNFLSDCNKQVQKLR